MAVYKVLFHPIEPYFLGNERSFGFDKGNIRYYAESKEMPSQSTILGTLRYLGLKHVKSDFDYTQEEKEENNQLVGERSFSLEDPPERYGKILGISPVFIHAQSKKEDKKSIYLPMPKNHDNKGSIYSPLQLSETAYETTEGCIKLPETFDVKKGITQDFVDLDSGKKILRDTLFGTDTRVGIKKAETGTAVGTDNSGFFKKGYKYLKQTKDQCFTFGCFVKTEAELWKQQKSMLAYIGQGKSMFQVTFLKVDGEENGLMQYLNMENVFAQTDINKLVYFISDAYVPHFDEKFKGLQDFSVIETVEYRGLTTKDGKNISYRERFKKDEALFKMISAGSVIYTENKKELLKIIQHPGLQAAGFNYCF